MREASALSGEGLVCCDFSVVFLGAFWFGFRWLRWLCFSFLGAFGCGFRWLCFGSKRWSGRASGRCRLWIRFLSARSSRVVVGCGWISGGLGFRFCILLVITWVWIWGLDLGVSVVPNTFREGFGIVYTMRPLLDLVRQVEDLK